MLLNYLDNIKNIGGHKRAAPYWAHLTTLDEQIQVQDTLQRAHIAAITGIEIAHQKTEMIARQEEFRCLEDDWFAEVGRLQEN